jgi:hypothetical protein
MNQRGQVMAGTGLTAAKRTVTAVKMAGLLSQLKNDHSA